MVIATPVPVRIQVGATPLPVHAIVGPSPISVHNADQADWWLAYGIPLGTLAASLLAALFAGLALRYIGEQIRIANKQTRIATEALTATQDSVTLAKQDLEATLAGLDATQRALQVTVDQAEKADRERAKAPILFLRINGAEEVVKSSANRPRTLEISVGNRGTRPAEDCSITLYLPASFRDPDDVEREQREAAMRNPLSYALSADIYDTVRPVDAKRVYLRKPKISQDFPNTRLHQISRTAGEQIVHGVPVLAFKVGVWMPEGRHELRWKIVSEGVTFPSEGTLGSIIILARNRGDRSITQKGVSRQRYNPPTQ
jgi:hypothetical protein